jgi:hypothetical protein
METTLGCGVEDWIAGKLPNDRPFHPYTYREGLDALRDVKGDLWKKMQILIIGFLEEYPIFCRAWGADPLECSASPHIHAIGGSGANHGLRVLHRRKQNADIGIARTLLHLSEALRAARSKDRTVGFPSYHVVLRSRANQSPPYGIVRLPADHDLLVRWLGEYKNRSTEPLDEPAATEMINSALVPHQFRRTAWLGARTLASEL